MGVSRFLLLLLLQTSSMQFGYCFEGDACSTLYARVGLYGKNFSLGNGDLSMNLEEDYRDSRIGWNVTNSINVERGCILNVCDEVYQSGTCQTLEEGKYREMPLLNIANECKCSNIRMGKRSCGRAYLKGGCSRCDSLYIELEGEEEYFPEEFVGKVEALRLRKGCALTVYEEEEHLGEAEIYNAETVENFLSTFHSYKCECDDSQYTLEPVVTPAQSGELNPTLISLPNTLSGLAKLLASSKYTNHPGVRAALSSVKSGRSPRKAYVLVLGSAGAGKSTAIKLLFGIDTPSDDGSQSIATEIRAFHFREYRIPVALGEYGLANTELRIIDTPGLGDTRGISQDAKMLATLDTYLANHADLKDRIPNVVLIFHKFHDNRYHDGEGSLFGKTLRALSLFSDKITDNFFSNVIFVFSHFCSETKANQRRPDRKLAGFKSYIEEYPSFPKPIMMSVAENKGKGEELPMHNGSFKLSNNEHYPRNLYEKMQTVTSNSKDLIGSGVLRSAFKNRNDDVVNASVKTFSTQRPSNAKEEYYYNFLVQTFFSVGETEINKLLQNVWDTEISSPLKTQHPGSLPRLQRALSYRNITEVSDLPTTISALIGLLTQLRQDEGTRELLLRSLKSSGANIPQSKVVGRGYNGLADSVLTSSPFKMEDVSALGIPKELVFSSSFHRKSNFYRFNTKQEYIRDRVKSLKISGDVSEGNFVGMRNIKPGYNVMGEHVENNSCSLSAVAETSLFDLRLNVYPEITQEFQNRVRGLPPFDEMSSESVSKWKMFFQRFGTHVVKSAFGGGQVQIQLKSKGVCNESMINILQGINSPEDLLFVTLPSGVSCSLTFLGGDPNYHISNLTELPLDDAFWFLGKWTRSLKASPVILTAEMELEPISKFAESLSQNYSAEIERAAQFFLANGLEYTPPSRVEDCEKCNCTQNERERALAYLATLLMKYSLFNFS